MCHLHATVRFGVRTIPRNVRHGQGCLTHVIFTTFRKVCIGTIPTRVQIFPEPLIDDGNCVWHREVMGEDSARLCHLKNEPESIVSVFCQFQSIATIAETVTIYIPEVATVPIYICLSGYIYNRATALDTASIYMPE